jgi:nicotinamidase/pyrazinamidase
VNTVFVDTVFIDVDTQIDFMYAAGALYVPGAEKIVAKIAALNQQALRNGLAVISTMDAHAEDDPEFKIWPHHCVVGTVGQQKCASTLLEKGARQIIIEKQTIDPFSNPKLAETLRELGAERFIVYGVVTEICVKKAVEGLLKTGARVEIVTDAIKSLSDDAGAKALAEFTAAGCSLITVADIVS